MVRSYLSLSITLFLSPLTISLSLYRSLFLSLLPVCLSLPLPSQNVLSLSPLLYLYLSLFNILTLTLSFFLSLHFLPWGKHAYHRLSVKTCFIVFIAFFLDLTKTAAVRTHITVNTMTLWRLFWFASKRTDQFRSYISTVKCFQKVLHTHFY